VALIVLRGMLRGLVAAHAAHVVHRDLKPGNVLLHLDGRPLSALTVDDVKIGDFGLGVGNADALRSMVVQSASMERDAQSGAIAGTLAYMAPEVRDGEQNPNARSDLYAVGVILHEMLTGERPAGAELPSTLRADAPPALDEVFRRLYARYDRRYESAEAALGDLDARLRRPVRESPAASQAVWPTASTAPRRARGHELTHCPGCEKPVEAEDQFCVACGRQLAAQVLRCTSCGGYPGSQDRFCIFCGTALASSEA